MQMNQGIVTWPSNLGALLHVLCRLLRIDFLQTNRAGPSDKFLAISCWVGQRFAELFVAADDNCLRFRP